MQNGESSSPRETLSHDIAQSDEHSKCQMKMNKDILRKLTSLFHLYHKWNSID